jgi:hypothetical protein
MNKMKYFMMISFLFLPTPILAQQVNTYGVCTQYREVYSPGYYDRYGNYVQGGVSTQAYQVPCNSNNQYYNNGNTSGGCRPAPTILGALLGGGVAASMSRGDGYAWSVPVGAAIGGALFGCN